MLARGDGLRPPLNAPPPQEVPPGVQPGTSQAVIVANTVIVIGSNGKILLYSPTRAAGNLKDSVAAVPGTDAGNAYLAGTTSYANLGGGGLRAVNMNGQLLAWDTAASAAGPWTQQVSLGLSFADAVHQTGPLVGSSGGLAVGSYVLLRPSGDTSGVTDWDNITGVLSGGAVCVLVPGASPFFVNQPVVLPDQGVLCSPDPSWGIPTGNYGAGPLPLQGPVITATAGFSGTGIITMGAVGTSQHGGQRLYGITVDGSLLPNGNSVNGIQSTGYVGGVKMRDVVVWGGFHAGVGGLGGAGLLATDDGTTGHNPDFWQVESSKFSDCGTWGVQTKGLADSWWTDCESTGNGTGGGWFVTDGADTRWTACRADSNGSVPGFSVTVTGGANLQFTGCEANLNGTGWVFAGSGSGNIRLANCIAAGNATAQYSHSGNSHVSTTGCDFNVWITVSPQNGWANSGVGPVAQYHWDGEDIVLIAEMTAGTLTGGTGVLTLPGITSAQTLPLLDRTTRTAQAQLNYGTGGTLTFFQGIGTVAGGDACFVSARVPSDA